MPKVTMKTAHVENLSQVKEKVGITNTNRNEVVLNKHNGVLNNPTQTF